MANQIEQAFQHLRDELEIRSAFPPEVIDEAERVARERQPVADDKRVDRLDIPFVTIDPPGSRDLDQAVHAERREGGFLVHYAIADIGFWVDRGSTIEAEAWLRGVTYYSPDVREPLYPPVLSGGVASLLPDQVSAAVLFVIDLDGRGELESWSVERAIVRSRRQLVYSDLLEGATEGTVRGDLIHEDWFETLPLLREIGRLRSLLEVERGGVSLPLRDQEVQRQTAAAIGYALNYESPSEAEKWNEQISLLTGHVAAIGMLEAGVGILRTMPPIEEKPVTKLRKIAATLGFEWPDSTSYAEFLHGLDLEHPRIEVLVRQARRVIRGADYVFFRGEPPKQPLHSAIALTYAHATAPLRRLADRYVLDLLADRASGVEPTASDLAALEKLPGVMNDADTRSSRLYRRVVDIAESAELADRVGDELEAVVVDVRDNEVEFQVEEPPVRASVRNGEKGSYVPELGEHVRVRVLEANVKEGVAKFEVVPSTVGPAKPGPRLSD